MAKKSGSERGKASEEKWTKPLVGAGFTIVPSVFLERQNALGLDPIDMNILLQLMCHWWQPNDHPYPSKRRIAERMGVHVSTIQKHVRRMEAAKLIQREPRSHAHGGRATNRYVLTGLIKAATPFAEEAIAAKKAAQAESASRLKRKRPRTARRENDND